MAANNFSAKIAYLFRRGEWEKARKLLEKERKKDPANHWVLTQLGVTYYEQRRYAEALELLLASLKIVADCPLTLWNLAGTLDSLGKPADAMEIYNWLLESKKSPKDDACWESQAWTDALKTDCWYRLGVCWQNLDKKRDAEKCYRQYVSLLLVGADGTYSIEDVAGKIRSLSGSRENGAKGYEVHKALNAALQASGSKPARRRRTTPSFAERDLLIGQLTPGKK